MQESKEADSRCPMAVDTLHDMSTSFLNFLKSIYLLETFHSNQTDQIRYLLDLIFTSLPTF